MLSDFDLDSLYGKRALKRFYLAFSSNAEQPQLVLPSRKSDLILDNFVAELIKTNSNDPIVNSSTKKLRMTILTASHDYLNLC